MEGSPKYSLHLSQKWQLSLAIYMFVITIIRKSVVKGKLKIRCRDYPCPSFEQNRVVSPLSYCRKGNESWTLLLKKTLLVCCHRPVSRAHPCLMFPALESSNVIMCFHLLRPICAKWKNHHLSEGVLMLQKHVAKHVRQRCKLTKPNG